LRVLLVEDSARLRESLSQGLREAGYAVDAVRDGREAFIHGCTTAYDVIVLDVMLPKMDGLTALRRLRERGVQSCVLMLTARDAIEDRVAGLRSGADDYLVKPFAFAELLARLEALTRRRHGVARPVMRIGPLEVDPGARAARMSGAEGDLDLTPREYAVLEYLAHCAGRPVSRGELEEHLYDERSQVTSNAVDVAICALRAKLERAGCPPLIRTRRKVGYVLSGDEP
jgi:DNA-binding response OmpR family regulator